VVDLLLIDYSIYQDAWYVNRQMGKLD
jgi:hypothetical protein